MTQTSMQSTTRLATRQVSELAPVLLAASPFGDMDAPIAAARWYAAREQRGLHVVATLERAESRVGAAELRQHGLDENAPLEVLDGTGAETIVEAARLRGAPIIVVGTDRQDGGGRANDDLAMRLVGATDRPVLVVPSDATPMQADVAVVAVDFSPASVRAARTVLPLVAFGGRLILVHVRTAVSLKEDTAEFWDELYARRCAALLTEFGRQLRPTAGVRVETRFLRGEAAGTVAAFAAGCGAGLIACGRKRRSALARALTGGVSTRLLRHATCAVLVVPEMPGDTAAR